MKNIKKYDEYLNEGLDLGDGKDQWLLDKISGLIKSNFNSSKIKNINKNRNGDITKMDYILDDDKITIKINWADEWEDEDDRIFSVNVLINNNYFDFDDDKEVKLAEYLIKRYDDNTKSISSNKKDEIYKKYEDK